MIDDPRPPSRRRFRLATLGTIAALAGLLTFAAGPANAAVPATPSGWTQVFADDFNGASGGGIDSQWMYDTGAGSSFGTGEIETMTNSTSNVHLDGNGNLDLTALNNGGDWTSGRVQTTSANVGAPAGGELEVTASIEQPTGGLGYWPAFWMLGPGQWPENGEIDIMEDVNSLSELSGTVHCGVDPGGVCNEPTGVGSGLVGCGGCQSGFHTYSMILNRTNTSAESITFYLDGNAYYTVNESTVGASVWQAAFDHNLSIILDLAMGGAYPNGVCGCTSPTSATTSGGTMQVDYVAAYTSTGGSGSGGSSSGSGGAVIGDDGLCLDVQGGNAVSSTPVQIYTCNGSAAQEWTFVQSGTTLQALGMCLDVVGGGTAGDTGVDLYTCNDTGAQVWIPQSNGSLYNPQSGKCLDDPNGSATSGTVLQIYDCNGTPAQQWDLPGSITSGVSSSLCVDDQSAVTADFNPIQIWGCNNTSAQDWTVDSTTNTLHVLGKCMDVENGATADGTSIDLFGCNGTGAQVWVPQSNGSLLNPQSGRCLDDPNGSSTPGALLQIYDCNGSPAQQWDLP